MIHLDTAALVASLGGPQTELPRLRRLIAGGERLGVSALALYEWLRGPRSPAELAAREAILPAESVAPFGAEEAELAAGLYRVLRRPRARAVDMAIAACALRREASLWTLNPRDFADIPNLRLLDLD